MRAASPSTETRTEARLTVPTLRRAQRRADGKGKKAPPNGAAPETIIPISGLHHRRRQGQALRAAYGRP